MVSAELCYGSELWLELGCPYVWDELLKYLELWEKEIPEMPSINFDDDSVSTFEEIKCIDVSLFRKLFDNQEICKEILPILFPTNKVLRLLYEYFLQKSYEESIYKTLSDKILEIIE